MKNKTKVILTIFIIIFIAICVMLFILIKNKVKIETEGEFTGVQLFLTAEYGGSDIMGRNLGSGIKKKIFNISEGDILCEPITQGLWCLNIPEQELNIQLPDLPNYTKILEIIKIEDNFIIINYNDTEYKLKYNEEINIPSNIYLSDTITYTYKISIKNID